MEKSGLKCTYRLFNLNFLPFLAQFLGNFSTLPVKKNSENPNKIKPNAKTNRMNHSK